MRTAFPAVLFSSDTHTCPPRTDGDSLQPPPLSRMRSGTHLDNIAKKLHHWMKCSGAILFEDEVHDIILL